MTEILQGDNLAVLREMPDESIDCCITSPPYYGLRDYGTGTWRGGDPNCDHVANASATKVFGNDFFNKNRPSREETKVAGYYLPVCQKCGAVRIDEQIGLESTPQEYIDRLVAVFREVKRVLKPQGTLWLNIADTYANKVGGVSKQRILSVFRGCSPLPCARTVGIFVKILFGRSRT